jgi:hypothetical protein
MLAAVRLAILLALPGLAGLASGCTQFKGSGGGSSGAPDAASDGGNPVGDSGPMGGDSGPTNDSGQPIDSGGATDTGPGDDGPPACDGSTCGIETILTGLNQGGTLAVDSANIYVQDQGTTTGEMYQCAKSGCASPITLGPGYATGIASDAQYVYWNDFGGGTIVRCAIGGCANQPTVLVPNQPHAEGLSFDGANLYWAANGSILACTSPACSSPTILATGQSTVIVTTSAETATVYWISSGSLLGCAATGCNQTPTVVTSNIANAGSVIVADGFAYYTSGNSIVSCPTTSTCAFPHTVGSSYQPFGLASDGSYVYWLDELIAQVFRCPVTGCVGSAEVFADQSSFDPAGEVGANVALDGEYVYWADPISVYRKHK